MSQYTMLLLLGGTLVTGCPAESDAFGCPTNELTVQLTDEAGQPICDAEVTAVSAEARIPLQAEDCTFVARTERSGQFQIVATASGKGQGGAELTLPNLDGCSSPLIANSTIALRSLAKCSLAIQSGERVLGADCRSGDSQCVHAGKIIDCDCSQTSVCAFGDGCRRDSDCYCACSPANEASNTLCADPACATP